MKLAHIRKYSLIAAVAVCAGGVFAVPAQSASSSECLGFKPNVVGTKGNDTIYVDADEVGAFATINNGPRIKVNQRSKEGWWLPVVIFGDKGNDIIHFSSDGGGTARVCAGEGKDYVSGGMITRIHAGSGYDTVEQYLECWLDSEVFAAETVRSEYDGSGDEGPCN